MNFDLCLSQDNHIIVIQYTFKESIVFILNSYKTKQKHSISNFFGIQVFNTLNLCLYICK